MDNLTETMDLNLNNSMQSHELEEDLMFLYMFILPIILFGCLLTFVLNLVIILAFPLIRNLSKVTRPYVTFIFSLLISDTFASLLLGLLLLFGSYLPVVGGISITGCVILIAEALKLAGVIVTVFHLLLMVIMHLIGVTHPVQCKKMLTQKMVRIMVHLLWAIPFGIILVLFSSIEGNAFRSDNCQTHDFLMEFPFRAIYSCLILVPTCLILLIYAYFHILLWHKRDITKSTVSKQNIRAAKTTLLIMFTCMCGWLPAVVNHLLVCHEGCLYHPDDFSPQSLFLMCSVVYTLVILKSLTNPLIFAIRQKNIREALKRLFYIIRYCKDKPISTSHLHSPAVSGANSRVNTPLKVKNLQVFTRGSTKSSFLSIRTSLLSEH